MAENKPKDEPKEAAAEARPSGRARAKQAEEAYQRTHANVDYVITHDAAGWHWQMEGQEISAPYPTRHEAELAAEAVITGP